MKKLFQELTRNCKGAVTVFVTLLLIPAVLVSGTGVDLARLYAAHSTVQDANQLAANSVLASYDALLQDLYGLYGIMQNDPELADMVDEYIRLAMFGGESTQRGMGTFQLFYGSNLVAGEVQPASGMNLANQGVLRRQIEEYAKFRAPAIIVDELLSTLDTFHDIQKDAKIIRDKTEIDQKIEDIDKLYEKLYKCINNVNTAEARADSAIESLNSFLSNIQEEFKAMVGTREQYVQAFDEGKTEQCENLEQKFNDHKQNIENLVIGGTIYQNWNPGYEDEEGKWVDGKWQSSYKSKGMNSSISESKKELSAFIENNTLTDDSLKEMRNLCAKADEKRAELKRMVDDLERKLNNNECSQAMKEGLTEPSVPVPNSNQKQSVMDSYRNMLSYNLTSMADTMAKLDAPRLRNVIETLENAAYMGRTPGGNRVSISRERLRDLSGDGYSIDLHIISRTLVGQEQIPDSLADAAQAKDIFYTLYSKRFELFQSPVFESTKNPEFYQVLVELYGGDGKDSLGRMLKSGLTKLMGQIQQQFKALLVFDPDGAYTYKQGENQSGDNGAGFASNGDWGVEEVQEAMDSNLLSRLGNSAGNVVDKMLLLTYDTEMFSCYTTNDGKSDEEPLEENMNGVPMSVDVNYYFQSELEYLYNGNLSSAKDNLRAVAEAILLVRFVINYIASFGVPSVTKVVTSVKSALAATGPMAIVVGELTRLVMALGESVIDLGNLKDGKTVALTKNSQNWNFSLEGVMDTASGVVRDLSASNFQSENSNSDVGGLDYRAYLRLMLLLVDGNELARRTSKLIELNVTNYRGNFGALPDRAARENAMNGAELFNMSKMMTDFSITTTVDLKMLFLSMPIARKGVNGVVPPGTVQVCVRDDRGY